jgi:NAD(P)H-hydrate epimerase
MYLTRQQARDLDRRVMTDFAVPGVVLMENAGRGMAELLLSLGAKGPVVICCGRGNNGGDGLVIARHLDIAGVETRVLLFAQGASLTGDAAINYAIHTRAGLPLVELASEPIDETALTGELARADWVVDALFGSGLVGPVRPPFDRVIAAVNASGKRVLAVDLPSGLDCDTGEPVGPTVRASHTATVVAPKAGFANPRAAAWTGQVHVVGMGAPRRALR